MSKNANEFRNFLKSINVTLEEETKDDDIIFSVNNTIQAGPTVRLIVVLPNGDNQAAVIGANYVTINNPSKKEYILEKINELNMKYTYNKFVLVDNTIGVQVFMAIDNNFSPETLWSFLLGAYDAMEEEYKGFMKIIWS